jgi:hypothetical protein
MNKHIIICHPMITIGLAFVISIIVSCNMEEPYLGYEVGFMNKSGRDLGYVTVYNNKGEEVAGCGWLDKSGNATYGLGTLPPEVEVRWVDKENNNTPHAKKFKIVGIPEKFDGYVYFIFKPNDVVDMKIIKSRFSKEYDEMSKGLRPEGEYTLGFVNKTGVDMKNVSVFYGDKQVCNIKKLLVRVGLDYSSSLTITIPSEAIVKWAENGTTYAAKVKINNIPKGFEGCIYFVFLNNGSVNATPVKNGDTEMAIKIVK